MNKDAIKKMRQAIKYGNLSTVKNLLDNDPNLAETDTPFGTWLQVAAAHGQTDIAKYLIDKGIDLSATYHLGEIENCDALEYARQYGQMKIYNYIKEKLNK